MLKQRANKSFGIHKIINGKFQNYAILNASKMRAFM